MILGGYPTDIVGDSNVPPDFDAAEDLLHNIDEERIVGQLADPTSLATTEPVASYVALVCWNVVQFGVCWTFC